MKAVMLSIQPRHCENIFTVIGNENGKPIYKKTIEVRKTRPSIETPFKVYIYQTKKKWIYRLLEKLGLYQRKVIGEFVCDRIEKIESCFEYYSDGYDLDDDILTDTCLTREEFMQYGNGKTLYGWHVSDLVIYDKPRELGKFWRPCPDKSEERIIDCVVGIKSCKYKTEALPFQCTAQLTRPPMSWCYVDEV